MGIDFSHCDASWAYSGFARFRDKLAAQVGLADYTEISSTDDPRFTAIKKDPIKYLLAHSDCDGHLTAIQCRKLAPRLRELLATWPDDDRDKQRGLELCTGLESAAELKQRLEFK